MPRQTQGCLVIDTEDVTGVVHLNDTGAPLEEVSALLHEVQPYFVDAMFYAPPAVVWRSQSLRTFMWSLVRCYRQPSMLSDARTAWADKAEALLKKGAECK